MIQKATARMSTGVGGWIVDRVGHLTNIFTIDVCAYAVMHNHYHLVLKIRSTAGLTDKQALKK
ncbi:MAG: hypothetical protein L3J24_14795 [Xanthomonadales bacterium]|nr:hypothetical protein [Xanthomonadales bacterium]